MRGRTLAEKEGIIIQVPLLYWFPAVCFRRQYRIETTIWKWYNDFQIWFQFWWTMWIFENAQHYQEGGCGIVVRMPYGE